jgi:NAD(P)-dependent dehydrogenase (short-subunit alcohol dehydrogenase family)
MAADRPFHGRTVWITGGTRGLGYALAAAFAEAGAGVIVGGRDAESGARAVARLSHLAPIAHYVPLDLCQPGSIRAFAEGALAALGPPSILVHNAGVARFRPLAETTLEDTDRMIGTNLRGPLLLTQAALPHLRAARDGAIVFVSSLAATAPVYRGTVYCATKAGLDMLAACVREEVRGDAIRTLLVRPGSIDTRFHLDSWPGAHPQNQDWMLAAADVASAIVSALRLPPHAMVSTLDIRPTQKKPA